MPDYADKQMVIDAVRSYYDECDEREESIEERISQLQSVDAVEIVRCKDCKYFDSGTDEDGKLFFKCLGWVYGGTSEDDFCSHGERKDG